ncbi:glycosyltransferase [Rhodobacterales bacterium]|nr:glycosyltransferase [Rhodobacterales bacterium]
MAISVMSIVLLLQLTVHAVQILALCLGRKPPDKKSAAIADVFFSVHLATRDEPPQLVIRTLERFSGQLEGDFGYQVIVIDNNTADPAVWRPVAQYCQQQRRGQFKFIHLDRLKGAKAGALNLALDCTSSKATHIVTIDADYLVEADFLSHAASEIRLSGADYVQFPQSYRHATGHGKGLSLEFADYFYNYARPSNWDDAMLLTGTLSVISLKAVESVGGWRSSTLTEDAELGTRLCCHPYRGRFVDRPVGTGLMPFDLATLQKQRARWTSGNAQTIFQRDLLAPLLFGRLLGRRRRLLILSQLTAWLQFTLVSSAALIGALLAFIGFGPSLALTVLASVASVSILLAFVAAIARLVAVGGARRVGARAMLSAIAARLALLPASGRATVDAVAGAGTFHVTAKRPSAVVSLGPAVRDHCALFVSGTVCMAVAIGLQLTLPALAALCLMAPLPAAVITSAELKRYRQAVLQHE